MPVTRIFPTAASPQYKRVVATGASEIAAITDSSDSTYIRRSAAGSPLARYKLQTPGIPAANDIATVAPGGRLRQATASAPVHVRLSVAVDDDAVRWVRAGDGGASIYDFASDPSTTSDHAPGFVVWKKTAGNLALLVDDGHTAADANRGILYRLWADVYHLAPATISLSRIPSSTAASCPTLEFPVSALIESWQTNEGPSTRSECIYQVRIFTAQQVSASGFSPDTTVPVWQARPAAGEEKVGSSPITPPLDFTGGTSNTTEQVTLTVDKPLTNGVYHVYARARRIIHGATWGGGWSSRQMTVGASPPPAPSVTATLAANTGHVTIAVTPTQGATQGSNVFVNVQRSTDHQVTFVDVPGGINVPGDWDTPTEIIDYGCPRNAEVYYRANITMIDSTGNRVAGLWRVVATGYSRPAGKWNIKAVDAIDTASVLDACVIASGDYQISEQAEIYRPVGRKAPVVVSMALGGVDSSMTVIATGQDISKLEALRRYRGTVLLESAYGWSRYIRIIERSWTEAGSRSSPYVTYSFAYLEVEAPGSSYVPPPEPPDDQFSAEWIYTPING